MPANPEGAARFADLLRRGLVVLSFYPADFTRVCTAETCMFRDARQELAAAGLTVVGVSPQSAESHERFAREHGLPFILVSDPEKRIIGSYGATWALGLGVRRVTFLIGGDGKIADRVVAELSVRAHRGFVERAVARLNSRPPAGA